MNQTTYQFLWSIYRGIFIRRVSLKEYYEGKDIPNKLAKQFYLQVKFALRLGIRKFTLFIGDSNVEFGNSYNQMIKFTKCGIVINIGIAGSTFDFWIKILSSEYGQKLLAIIYLSEPLILLNLGGNHVLGNTVEKMENHVTDFKNLFPEKQRFVVCDLPMIYVPILSKAFNISEERLSNNLRYANEVLKGKFEKFIKLGDFFYDLNKILDNSGYVFELSLNALSDPIHYSKGFNKKYRFPYYSKVIRELK